jgi:hypothetical protein
MLMKFPLSFRCRRRRRSGVVLSCAFAWVATAVACGPEFPNCYLLHSEAQLLAAPVASFAAEIARLPKTLPTTLAGLRHVATPANEVVARDVAGVRAALGEGKLPAGEREKILAGYEEARRRLAELASEEAAPSPGRAPKMLPEVRIDLPVGLPREFALYFAGSVAWHRGDSFGASASWSELMELPETQRRHRSVWAAFMLGRAWLAKTPGGSSSDGAVEATKSFKLVRELVARGFPDPLGLAAASIGWEARAALDARDHATAIELYLAHHALGDPTAVESLRVAAREFLKDYDPKWTEAAKRPVVRRVLTAYFTSRSGSRAHDARNQADFDELARRWAETLALAGVRDDAQADRLAWVAYQAGLFPLAERWLAVASEKSAATQWLRAKLALRRGDLAGGEKCLRDALAVGGLDRPHAQLLAAELGRVCLARDNFAGAVAAALAGNHWQDAAFVAEHLMSTAELRAFVDARPPVIAGAAVGAAILAKTPDKDQDEDSDRWAWWPEDLSGRLRGLLARRLVREGKADDAEAYFPTELRAVYRGYIADVRTGFDGARPAEARAAAFWRAARCAREKGDVLLGTELQPDWGIWSGNFTDGVTIQDRAVRLPLKGGLFAPTTFEVERLSARRVPEKRFHYRYRAADLAWWAAALLPNDSDETARILVEAGGWLKARDPIRAQQFYQALVIRCGNTPLGRAAAAKRWFPAEPETKP